MGVSVSWLYALECSWRGILCIDIVGGSGRRVRQGRAQVMTLLDATVGSVQFSSLLFRVSVIVRGW